MIPSLLASSLVPLLCPPTFRRLREFGEVSALLLTDNT